ncbi:DUF3192 domain-containing protein [Ferrimonas pelagia]|uniref:DUF3192 domain-containing protein n=1 Tax=Ferrimonas pelagia TaxID=1177826 RepID=A0ABP9EIP5_9GAMM
MKNRLVLATLVFAASTALTGCVVSVGGGGDWDKGSHSSWQKKQEINRKNLEQIALGMGVEEVRRIMGTADFNEVYQRDDHSVQVLFYRTHRQKGDGSTSKDECTPVVFHAGEVVGWGDTAYRQAITF